MEHIYHKGKYRSFERWKHLRPFLKRSGNKRWRSDGRKACAEDLEYDGLAVAGSTRHLPKKRVRVKLTIQDHIGRTRQVYKTYDSLPKARAAILRYGVIRVTIFTPDRKIKERHERPYKNPVAGYSFATKSNDTVRVRIW